MPEASLFPMPAMPDPLPLRLRLIHRRYGACDGRKCGECGHFGEHPYRSRTYFKCGLTLQTCGAGTDWRRSWPACGAFVEPVK